MATPDEQAVAALAQALGPTIEAFASVVRALEVQFAEMDERIDAITERVARIDRSPS